MIAAILLLLAQFPFPGPGPRATGTGPSGPCGTTYAHCATYTVSSSKVGSGGVTSFPVLISKTVANLAVVGSGGQVLNTVAQTGGNGITVPADFSVTSDSLCATKIPFEFELYTQTTGAFIIHALVPALSSSTGGVVYLCWGASGVTTFQGNVAAVWAAYSFASHLSTPGGMLNSADSSGNTAIAGTSATAGTGEIDGGGTFNGSQFVSMNDYTASHATTTLTVSCWVNQTANSGTEDWVKKDGNYILHDGGGIYNMIWFDGSNVVVSSYVNSSYGVYHHVVGTVASNAITGLYVDGASVGSAQSILFGSARTLTNPVLLGAQNGGGEWFTGTLDECRISTTFAATQAWVTTEYNNQSSPSTFATFTQTN